MILSITNTGYNNGCYSYCLSNGIVRIEWSYWYTDTCMKDDVIQKLIDDIKSYACSIWVEITWSIVVYPYIRKELWMREHKWMEMSQEEVLSECIKYLF